MSDSDGDRAERPVEQTPHVGVRSPSRTAVLAATFGAPIGVLGGLIGLGGAELRLPVLKAVFRYDARRAVAVNLAVSLVTLAAACVMRVAKVDGAALAAIAPVAGGMVLGSVTGAWMGASFASKLSVERLEHAILVLLVAIGIGLCVEAFLPHGSPGIAGGLVVRIPLAMILGVAIGIVSSMLGVAGGEMIIPSLVFVFGADVKLAGTASVLISLPTVVVGCWRWARRGAYASRAEIRSLVLPMGIGSVIGALAGAALVPYVPARWIKLGLGLLLVASALRVFRSAKKP